MVSILQDMQKGAPPPLLPLLRSRLQAEVLTLVLLTPDQEWTLILEGNSDVMPNPQDNDAQHIAAHT